MLFDNRVRILSDGEKQIDYILRGFMGDLSINNVKNVTDFESRYLISRNLPPLSIEYQDNDIHLIFRPYHYDDLKKVELALVRTLPSLYKFTPWQLKKWDSKDCLTWLTKSQGNYFLGTEFEWGCFDNHTGEFLLSIGIMQTMPMNPDCWEIGYWTDVNHTKKGLATLATKIITAVVFRCLNVNRLQVGCMKENTASIRVIEKCGFRFEGELRGLFPLPPKELLELGAIASNTDFLYALLPEDWAKLEWFESIINKIEVLSLSQKKHTLSQLE